MMRDVDIARWRLRSQRLVAPYAGSAGEAVGSLLAVQAENPGQAAWAVASRTQDPSALLHRARPGHRARRARVE